jgi:hypothetical protein
MFQFIGSVISTFLFWLFLGLLGDWALWWEFSEYLALSGEIVDAIRQILIRIGEEIKS